MKDLTPTGAITIQTTGIKPYIDGFIKYLDTSNKTKDDYKKALLRFNNWYSTANYQKITRETVLRYKEYLKSHYKASTVNSYLSALKQFFGYAEAVLRIPDVTRGIKALRRSSGHLKDPLSGQQVNQILKTILESEEKELVKKRDYALIKLMVGCGLRLVEVVNADVSDLATRGGKNILVIRGKGETDKGRVVVLVPHVYKAIMEYLKVRNGSVKENSPLFTSTSNRNKDGRMTNFSISRVVGEWLKRSGVKTTRITPHSLRHSAATIAGENNAQLEKIQQMLGHRQITTTMIYKHQVDRLENPAEEFVNY